MIAQTTDIYCPECGEHAEDMPPQDWPGPDSIPEYRHVTDRTALCSVPSRRGDRPAEPVEYSAREFGAGA